MNQKYISEFTGKEIDERIEKVPSCMNNIAINRATLGYQCKNLLPIIFENDTHTVNLLTYFLPSDGSNDNAPSIVFSTEANTEDTIVQFTEQFVLYPGKYILSGCIGGSSSTYYIQLANVDSSINYSGETTFEITEKTVTHAQLYVCAGQTINTTMLQVMLRFADIIDGTYEAYKGTVDSRFNDVDARFSDVNSGLDELNVRLDDAEPRITDVESQVSQNKIDIASNSVTLGYRTKNILMVKPMNRSKSNITAVLNDDSSIILNGNTSSSIIEMYSNMQSGTSANSTSLNCIDWKKHIANGKYILSLPENSGIRIIVNAYNVNLGHPITLASVSDGGSDTFEVKDEHIAVWTELDILANRTFNNATVYPMICSADAADDTWVQYSPTINSRINQNTTDISLNRSTLGHNAKNILSVTGISRVESGITFTVYDNGCIVANGTAENDIMYDVTLKAPLKSGTYKYTGFAGYQSGSSETTYGYEIEIYDDNRLKDTIHYYSGDNERYNNFALVPMSYDGYITVYIKICAGTNLDYIHFYPMLRDENILDDSYETYSPPIYLDFKNFATTFENTLGYYCVNLLKPTVTTGVVSGIPITVNDDKSVTFGEGTTTDECIVTVGRFTCIANLTYILSGAPDDGDVGTRLYFTDDDGNEVGGYYQDGSGMVFNFNESTTYNVCARVAEAGVEITEPITFYPMIRYAFINTATYEPYTPSVQEQIKTLKYEAGKDADDLAKYILVNEDAHYEMSTKIDTNTAAIEANTEAINSNTENLTSETARAIEEDAVNRSSIGFQKKNLLPNKATTQTIKGVTFTINEDGSVSVSGTASANTQLDIGKFPLTASTEYTLSGCPDGGSESSYYLYGLYTSNWAGLGGKDTGSGYKFTAQWSGEVVFRVYITSGTTVDNLTFYPMLRYAAIEDVTYETYTPSLLERIEALQKQIDALSATASAQSD